MDGHIQAVEDSTFAISSVVTTRSQWASCGLKSQDWEIIQGVFRNGVLLATGAVFGIEGLVYGTQLLLKIVNHPPTSGMPHDAQKFRSLSANTSYEFMAFLMWFLSLLFCVAGQYGLGPK